MRLERINRLLVMKDKDIEKYLDDTEQVELQSILDNYSYVPFCWDIPQQEMGGK